MNYKYIKPTIAKRQFCGFRRSSHESTLRAIATALKAEKENWKTFEK